MNTSVPEILGGFAFGVVITLLARYFDKVPASASKLRKYSGNALPGAPGIAQITADDVDLESTAGGSTVMNFTIDNVTIALIPYHDGALTSEEVEDGD